MRPAISSALRAPAARTALAVLAALALAACLSHDDGANPVCACEVTGDTGDTADTGDTGDTGDTSDTGDTGDTGGSGPHL